MEPEPDKVVNPYILALIRAYFTFHHLLYPTVEEKGKSRTKTVVSKSWPDIHLDLIHAIPCMAYATLYYLPILGNGTFIHTMQHFNLSYIRPYACYLCQSGSLSHHTSIQINLHPCLRSRLAIYAYV